MIVESNFITGILRFFKRTKLAFKDAGLQNLTVVIVFLLLLFVIIIINFAARKDNYKKNDRADGILGIGNQAGITYYVSPGGNDSNPGTSTSSPWRSISKVNSTSFSPGDSILFQRGGVWTEKLIISSSGVSGNPIIFGAYGSGELPEINLNEEYTSSWTVHSGNIWRSQSSLIPMYINGNYIRNVDDISKVTSNYKMYRDTSTNPYTLYMYSTTNPNTSAIEAGSYTSGSSNDIGISIYDQNYIIIEDFEVVACDNGIEIKNQASAGTEGNHILRNLVVRGSYNSLIDLKSTSNNIVELVNAYDSGYMGLYIDISGAGEISTNNILRDNTVYGVNGAGLMIEGFDTDTRSSENYVYDNTSYNNGDGAYIRYADSTHLYNNQLYSNKETSEVLGEGYGVGIQSGSDNMIYSNVMSDNRRMGIEVWGGGTAPNGYSNRNKIYRNIIKENDNRGVFYSATYIQDTELYSNLIYNNVNDGLYISNSGTSGSKILNNTFYNNGGYALYSTGSANISDLINNLFINNGNSVKIYSSNTHSNNGYYSTSLLINSTTYSGSQILSQESNSKVDNPLFTNPGAGDFSLQAGSMYINAGVNVGLTSDFYNLTIVGLPDVGAIEYGTSGVTNTPTNTPSNTPITPATSTPITPPTSTPITPVTSTPTRTPTPTNTPTNTPTKTPTITPSSTPTRITTNTPTSTPSNTPTVTPSPTIQSFKNRGDLNNDKRVNLSDLSILASNWYTSSASSDVNGDGIVNLTDLSIMASNWQEVF